MRAGFVRRGTGHGVSPQFDQLPGRQVLKVGRQRCAYPLLYVPLVNLQIGAEVMGFVALTLAMADQSDFPAPHEGGRDLFEKPDVFREILFAISVMIRAVDGMLQMPNLPIPL